MSNAAALVLESPRNMNLRHFVIPEIGSDDAILKVEACGLCGTDYEQWLGHLGDWGGGMPIVPGHEIMGYIDRIGPGAAKRWGVREGDRVAVEPIVPCGHCADCVVGAYTRCQSDVGYGLYHGTKVAPSLWGGYATHVYLHPRTMVHRLPQDIPTDVMSLVNPLSNAIRWVYEVGGAALGKTVIIAGPGQRGLLAAFAARRAGAARVIVTGTSADKARLDLALQLGATDVLETGSDLVARVTELTNGELADVVLDVSSGAMQPIVEGVDLVKRGGRIVLAGLKGNQPLNGLPIDKVVLREIQLLGVLSAGWQSTELAIELIKQDGPKLAPLCTHSFSLNDGTAAVRTLGRELSDGREAIHITLTPE
ncbi:zinc-binding alcohol dehydrogenase [Paraburkholderia dipogonis]|uniref:Zinc-binding alcohol dehydrogenase n=1 Tax=Paraburkholderia dipogonis TaxID=1211383 RepID=A0A4Y8MK49_9BURK|nr:zinc-binding dehydrogenase [Paraburkholderia dipogonis]TFE37811.1 zinc-binding alcohol dehydrogenase [Paraburkholderia dipogonis]